MSSYLITKNYEREIILIHWVITDEYCSVKTHEVKFILKTWNALINSQLESILKFNQIMTLLRSKNIQRGVG